MALASLIFGGNSRSQFKTGSDVKGAASKVFLTIDATIKSTHTSTASITKRELEEGVQINDHMIVDPDSVSIDGVVSETPLDFFGSLASSAVGASASMMSQQLGAGAVAATGVLGGAILNAINGSRAKNAYQQMTDLQKNRTLFDFVTGLKSYKNMMLTSFVATRTAKIGKSMEFTATMEKVTFVSSEIVTLGEKDIAGLAGSSAAGSTNLGKQTASVANTDTSSNGSLLFKAFGGLF